MQAYPLLRMPQVPEDTAPFPMLELSATPRPPPTVHGGWSQELVLSFGKSHGSRAPSAGSIRYDAQAGTLEPALRPRLELRPYDRIHPLFLKIPSPIQWPCWTHNAAGGQNVRLGFNPPG